MLDLLLTFGKEIGGATIHWPEVLKKLRCGYEDSPALAAAGFMMDHDLDVAV